MNYDKDTKDYLLRALITKMCEEKEYIDLRYDKDFFEDHWLIFKKINDRKNDMPSLTYIKETYKFKPHATDYTVTDLVEKLNQFYYYEKTNIVLRDVINARKNGTDTSDAINALDNLNKEFSKIRSAITNTHVVDIANEPEKVAEEYRKVKENLTLIPTGLGRLDDICCPRLGNFLLLCAATGGGKSLIMTHMQKSANENNIPSLYISLEMTLVEQTNRLLALKGIKSFTDLHNNKVDPKEYQELVKQLNSSNTHILTRTTETKINLQTIEKYVQELKPRVVFLDYMTLLQDADFSWNSEVSISAELKRIALQNNLLMISAVQADSASMTSGEAPDLHNVRGNKSFSFDTDMFIGLASERYLTEPDKFKFKFAVRKNRNGILTEFAYRVKPETGMFQDITDDVANGLA
jgi:replicative DNA helicase